MRSLFSRLTGSFSKPAPVEIPPLEVARPAAYIGDLHGRADLLERMLHKLETDHLEVAQSAVVFLGDYVDRGDHSADVLARLHQLSQDHPSVICLKGNHEDMMLRFIRNPRDRGDSWLKHGGLQTLASYRIALPNGTRKGDWLVPVADALEEAIGPEMLDWIDALPSHHLNGNLAAVHAGADPSVPITSQSDTTLQWGHAQFDTVARTDQIRCVHGHTIRDHAGAGPVGHIGVDTGAYATGVLSAALMIPGVPEPIYITA